MNLDAWFAMSGQEAYVWSALGLSLALMATEVLRLRRRIRAARAGSAWARSEHAR